MYQEILVVGSKDSAASKHLHAMIALGNLRAKELEAIYERRRNESGDKYPQYTSVHRVGSTEELLRMMETVSDLGPIQLLDILDHGREGLMELGRDVVFQSDGQKLVHGEGLARKLAPYMSGRAQLRFLGCKTGVGKRGRGLLLAVAKELGGGRVVYGTIGRIYRNMFKSGQFAQEQELLVSSDGLLDAAGPSYDQRIANLRKVWDYLPG